MRGQVESVGSDEEPITLSLDRHEIALAVLPDGRIARDLPTGARSGPPLPVPHFRSAMLAHNDQRTVIIRRPRDLTLPLAVWIAAAMIAGTVTFFLAPQARASLQEVVHGTHSEPR